jgi:hypothetical protein
MSGKKVKKDFRASFFIEPGSASGGHFLKNGKPVSQE